MGACLTDSKDVGAEGYVELSKLRQEIRDVRTTSQRQLWVLIGVVVVPMVGGMIKVVFFP